MGIEFTNPAALLLLLLAPLTVAGWRRTRLFTSKIRAGLIVSFRAAILVLIVLALAGLRLRTSSTDLAVIFLVDVSASVAQDEQRAAIEFINREVDRAPPRDFVGVIAFAREPSVELAPTRKEALPDRPLEQINSNPARDYTDVASAVRLAAALVPESATGRLVLMSDGDENLETAAQYVPLLQSQGIEVHVVQMKRFTDRQVSPAELAVREVSGPSRVAEGEAFNLQVAIDSTREAETVLRVFRNDSLVSERRATLAPFGDNVFILPQRVDQSGFYRYRADVEAIDADLFTQNNSAGALVLVEGPPRTLYLYGDTASLAIARVLREGNFVFESRAAAALPGSLAAFQTYDLVILDNVPADSMTRDQMKMIRSYVHDLGGGFVMIGGDKSFGVGGYYKTPVEEVLPVSLDIRNKKHLPGLALVLVIDKSGSMNELQAGRSKIEVAVEAASSAVEALSERDWVGVVAFDQQAHEVVKLTHVEDKNAIREALGGIGAGGGTAMYPGLQMAYRSLLSSEAQIKHIIVLSDGESEPGDFPGIARSISDAGITLSSVAVGETAAFELMRMLADAGGGRYYETDTPESLAAIFTREAFLASRGAIVEEPFVPLPVRATQATAGIDWSKAPQLLGYVGTAERDPSVAITALVSHKDDPVFAVWQHGLGRSAAFTSDAKPRWAAGWMNWPGFGQFWTQVFRDIVRREGSDAALRVESRVGFDDAREQDRRGRIEVDVTTPEGQFKNDLKLRARVVAPDLTATEIPLTQTAAGRYEGYFAAPARGSYLATVIQDEATTIAATGGVKQYSPEFVIAGADATLLEQLSMATGGRILGSASPDDTEGGLFDRRSTKTIPHEVWQSLILLALLLLPIDVGMRRVRVSREDLTAALEAALTRIRLLSESLWGLRRPLEAGPGLDRLKASRLRVRLRGPADVTEPDESVPVRISKKPDPVGAMKGDDIVEEQPKRAQPDSLASRLLDARRRRRE